MALADKCKIGFGLLIFLFFGSCSEEKKEPIPSNVLPMAKMENFLLDLHKTESKLLISGIRQDTAARIFEVLEKKLYKKHKLDTGLVKRSLRYYTTHIDLMDSIYRHLEMKVQQSDSTLKPDSL